MAALMSQIAQSADANFTVTVLSSQRLGTQAQQLAGEPGFVLDVFTDPINVPR